MHKTKLLFASLVRGAWLLTAHQDQSYKSGSKRYVARHEDATREEPYLKRPFAAFQPLSASFPALSAAPIDARSVAVTGTSAAWSRLSCPASVVVAPASVFGPAGGGGGSAAAGCGGAAAGAPRRDVSGGAGASSSALIALRFNVSLIANTARNSPACVTAS